MKGKEGRSLRICLAASAGGHWEQIRNLEVLLDEFDGFFVTEKIPADMGREGHPVFYLKHVNRHQWNFLPKLLANTWISWRILCREKPDVVITTGVLAVVPLCYLARLMGKKLIFIESYAKINSPTLSGKFLYPIANYTYVQWEEMIKCYPKAQFKGVLY